VKAVVSQPLSRQLLTGVSQRLVVLSAQAATPQSLQVV
jgi:hypothetical protein